MTLYSKLLCFFLLIQVAKAQEYRTFNFDFSKSAKKIVQKNFTKDRKSDSDTLVIDGRTFYEQGATTYSLSVRYDTTFVKMSYGSQPDKEYIADVYKDDILIQSISSFKDSKSFIQLYNFQDKLLTNYTAFSQGESTTIECKEYFYNKQKQLLKTIEVSQQRDQIDSLKRLYYYNKLSIVSERAEVKENDKWQKFYYTINKFSPDKIYRYESTMIYDKREKKFYKRYEKRYLVKNNILLEEQEFSKSEGTPYETKQYDKKGRMILQDFKNRDNTYRRKRQFTYLNNSDDYTLFAINGAQTEFEKKETRTYENFQVEKWRSCNENFQNCDSIQKMTKTVLNENKDWIRKEMYIGDNLVELQTREIFY